MDDRNEDSQKFKVDSKASESELVFREQFLTYFRTCPIPDNEMLDNLGLFMNRQTLSRRLFLHELYKQIININGVIMEFGVRWGQNLALFESFRGMYEPYNYTRKIIGFDTFCGFPSVDSKDGQCEVASVGAYSVTEGYENYLRKLLDYHELESPLSHIKKYQLIKGDATETVKKYLQDHPETIIAFAYFDFDIYEPTKKCLEMIKDYLSKGSIVAFDQLNHHDFPGETLAFKEIFVLSRYKIIRSPLNSYLSYIVYE